MPDATAGLPGDFASESRWQAPDPVSPDHAAPNEKSDAPREAGEHPKVERVNPGKDIRFGQKRMN
jgi:hypothetical protein